MKIKLTKKLFILVFFSAMVPCVTQPGGSPWDLLMVTDSATSFPMFKVCFSLYDDNRKKAIISDYSLLQNAVCCGSIKKIKLLIESGADVNVRDRNGVTPLLQATENGYLEGVELLLASGADVNKEENGGGTPLIYAAMHGYLNIIKSLLAHKADLNKESNNGGTALMYASKYGHSNIVASLLAHKADPGRQANNGSTALSLALKTVGSKSSSSDLKKCCLEVVKLLRCSEKKEKKNKN